MFSSQGSFLLPLFLMVTLMFNNSLALHDKTWALNLPHCCSGLLFNINA